MKTEESKKEMNRRSFFKWGGLSLLGMMVLGKVRPYSTLGGLPSEYWNEDGSFHQDNVDVSNIDQGIIRAKVFKAQKLAGTEIMYKTWKEFSVVNVELSFIDWNFTERIAEIDRIMGGERSYSGASCPSVASFGGVRPPEDQWNRSQFSLNNAIKRMEPAPKEPVIDDIIMGLYEHWNDSDPDKFLYLRSLYSMRDLWDMNKQVSLELYATPERLTHSFRNWMENPLANIDFVGFEIQYSPPPPRIPSNELRTIVHMIHPLDPVYDDENYEFKLTKFTNTIYNFFLNLPIPSRGDMKIGVIHYICEEFDNNQFTGQGQRVALLRALNWSRNLCAKGLGKTKQIFA